MLRKIAGPQFTVLLVVIIMSGWLARGEVSLRGSPAKQQEFHDSDDRAEDRIPDPLILSGRGLMPLVLTEVQSRDMRLRRYAIGFPGSGGDPEALDELESIVSDVQESHHVRADALLAIYNLAPSHAREVAPKYVHAAEPLGRLAREIVEGDNPVNRTRSAKRTCVSSTGPAALHEQRATSNE